jgi:DNA (cytosine-5)-methyltransferase 1
MPETVIDLFCGIGGLTHGFVQEGFRVAAGIDIDRTCRHAYEVNNAGATFIGKPLELISNEDLEALYPVGHTRILVGCAPCQPFSSANTKRASGKWRLVETFADRIESLMPEVVSMENVLQLKSFEGGKVFSAFTERLRSLGYTVTHHAVNAADYGVPQRRRRLVVFASLRGEVLLASPTHSSKGQTLPRHVSVREAIAHLPVIEAGASHPNDELHAASGLTDINLERIRASRPGGSWHDWDEILRAPCHRRIGGKKSPSVYGRMEWDTPAPSITTQFHGFGNGRYGHPEQDRALSLREGALLQSFPETYDFNPNRKTVEINKVARYVGNAVPVSLARAIARSIRNHLQ